ncbi:MAG TPA: hypothetical protein VES20_25535, partial [Bryobacteraceae bacterium]|nr:hypothetical protein [Bryobacteraceae bacterium]
MKYSAVALFALSFVACAPPRPTDSVKTQTAEPEYYRVDASTAGKLAGVVRFTGSRPRGRVISMNAEEACEAMHSSGVPEETVV